MNDQAHKQEISMLEDRIRALEQRCIEAEDTLDAIRTGAVDALVVYSDEGDKIFTLKGAETTYRLLVESIGESVVTLIEDGTILYCNRRFAEMLATPQEMIIGSSIYQYIAQEYTQAFSSLLIQGIQEGCTNGNCRDELEFIRDGSIPIPVLISINNFSAIGSRGVCLVASDLTEKKKTEQQILNNIKNAEILSEYSRSLVESGMDEQRILESAIKTGIKLIGDLCIIRLLTGDGKFLPVAAHYHPDPEINRFLEQGKGTAVLQNENTLDFQVIQTGQGLLIPSIASIPDQLFISKESMAQINRLMVSSLLIVPLRTKTMTIGSYTFGRLPASQPFTPEELELAQRISNQATLAIANARLYKELQNALQEEQIMRSQLIQVEKLSALSRMMATVVHEISTPLQTIKNCLYLVNLEAPAGASVHEALNIASSEIDRISKLVVSLREIYRPARQKKMEYLGIQDLLGEVHSLLASHLQHNNVVWNQKGHTSHFWVYGIADELKQVFLNISMNAIDAMAPLGGTITISTISDSDRQEVAVEIADDGPGIDLENQDRLFEPFFTTKQHGSGLGLPICHEIVNRHSGHITVKSKPGKGAAFTVHLPISQKSE